MKEPPKTAFPVPEQVPAMTRIREFLARGALKAAARISTRDLSAALDPERIHLSLEQPTSSSNEPRWGWGRPRHRQLERLLATHADEYVSRLALIERYGAQLASIDRGEREDEEPCWTNPMCFGLDGASIYCFLRDREPQRYLEIGSGYSTKFAARAKRDGGLRTELISIDPAPRADIDPLCDRVLRARLEDLDLLLFAELEAGDVVFLDGSHRLYMNNDVSTFFLDVLPALPRDVLVGLHDVYLPDDYAPDHAGYYWTEQYVLAVALLAGGSRLRPVLPCHYVCTDSALRPRVIELWERIGLAGTNAWGCSFWFASSLGQ